MKNILSPTIEFDEVGCPKNLSGNWTLEERLATVAFLASVIASDVSMNRYSAVGRPNSVSVQYVCGLPAEELEAAGLRDLLAKYAAELRENIIYPARPS